MARAAERRINDSVEWLAALWELVEGTNPPRCANPRLLTLLLFAPRLKAHPALAEVARRRRTHTRDQLIKEVVAAGYADASGGGLYPLLRTFADEAEELIGAGPHRLIRDARDEALRRVEELAGEIDPAADLLEVTGERLPLRVVLAPSVFLPPPQAGRHGALIPRGAEQVAHLHFGFPLNQALQQYGISRPWLLGGAWHYAIEVYLQRHWPPIARRLELRPELAEAVPAALGLTADDPQPWTDVLRAHVNIAFKCLLSRRVRVPDNVHRAFAKARGLVLFPWFEEWLRRCETEGPALTAHLATLPQALAADRERWQGLADAAGGAPVAINLALLSASARRASLVVPDSWGEEADDAVAGWRLLPLPVVRYGEWARRRATTEGDTAPAIAFGTPEENPLVRRVLEQRGLTLEPEAAADRAVVALSTPDFDAADWCIAVAVQGASAAAALRMEMALKQTSLYFVLEGGEVVEACASPLDGQQVAAAARPSHPSPTSRTTSMEESVAQVTPR